MEQKRKRGRPATKKYYSYSKTRKKPRHRSEREYDFLQYIRIVMRWATAHTGLNRQEIELLLYLYPKGAFTKNEFFVFHRTISMYQDKTFDKLMEEGWMKMWRPKKGKESALFCLTTKAKIVCSKMHQFCVGDKEIAVKTRTNPLVNSKVRMDSYYMDMIVSMNKRKKEETEE